MIDGLHWCEARSGTFTISIHFPLGRGLFRGGLLDNDDNHDHNHNNHHHGRRLVTRLKWNAVHIQYVEEWGIVTN